MQRQWPAERPSARLLLCLCLFIAIPAQADESTARASHRQALNDARQGDHSKALATLQSLMQRFPNERRYLFDYITVLGWAEKDAEVLAILPRIDLDRAPAYVLETLGKSARNLKRYPLAIDIYRRSVRRYPQRSQSRIGLALSLADNGETEEAATLISRRAQPANSDLLNARAYVGIKQKDYFTSLTAYEQALRSDPQNRQARKGLILLTARLGAPHLAADMAAEYPDLLTASEQDAIDRDRTAMAIRWGRLPTDQEPEAGHETDQAIVALRQQLPPPGSPANGRLVRKLKYDLIEALHDRRRYFEVIATYASLATGDDAEPLPIAVLAAVADSYLQWKAPDKALSLLEQIDARHPHDFANRLAMVYAYVDNEQFDEARALISRLIAEEPRWLKEKNGKPRQKNDRRIRAEVTAAMVAAFADDLDSGQQGIQRLLARAPNNPGLRTDLGYIDLWRGLPNAALKEFNLSLAIDPDHFPARQGRVAALYDLSAFRQSHRELLSLAKQRPLDGGVKKRLRTWQLHSMRELRVSSSYGLSSGNQVGSRDFHLDGWLYSRPLDDRYRAFLYSHFATASFPEGGGEYRRLGIGVEYRRRQLTLTSILTGNTDGQTSNAGLGLNARWLLSDHWRLGLSYDSNSNDIPLRGRLNEQIDGWSTEIDISYYFHESRRIDTVLKLLHFSDGNIRQSLSASLFQRLVSRPHYKLDGIAGLYGSSNSRLNASYFNPEQDLGLDITLINEWLLYRHYTRSFRHRLGFSLGSYRQSGFAGSASGQVFYEQQWNPDDTFEIIYGVSLANRTYDGLSENQTRIYMNLDWLF